MVLMPEPKLRPVQSALKDAQEQLQIKEECLANAQASHRHEKLEIQQANSLREQRLRTESHQSAETLKLQHARY